MRRLPRSISVLSRLVLLTAASACGEDASRTSASPERPPERAASDAPTELAGPGAEGPGVPPPPSEPVESPIRVNEPVPSGGEAVPEITATERPGVRAVPEADEAPALDQRIERAVTEAATHAPRGVDTCDTAVKGIVAMMEAAESASPGQRLPRPDREDFLVACRRLPPPAQLCLVPAHSLDHPDACAATLRALSPDALAALQSAMETQANE